MVSVQVKISWDVLIANAKNKRYGKMQNNSLQMLKGLVLLVVISLVLWMVFPPTLNQMVYSTLDLTQHITATGRFSGRKPNMQNMPRGGTFPVKRVFISRWEGGHIMEADFAQLEFRAAAFLSQDPVAMQEIDTGFDVHCLHC